MLILRPSLRERRCLKDGGMPKRVFKVWFQQSRYWLAGFHKLDSLGFRKRIQHGEIVIWQAFNNESLFPRSPGRWLPPGFPGESACR